MPKPNQMVQPGRLRIVVPDHARQRAAQRGLSLTQRMVRAMLALQARSDISNQEPLALLSEDGQKVVFEFRRRKSRAVVATVLDGEQQPKAGTRLFPLAALET